MSIKENILFGRDFNQPKYEETLRICQLELDLASLPAGDDTEIGEKGINLSGGQKARVSLARAVYSEKPIVLMDDPISALDSNIKKKVFEQVFLDKMQGKTRVLVTHAVDYLHLCDRIIVMKDGRVAIQGTYQDIMHTKYIKEIMLIHN